METIIEPNKKYDEKLDALKWKKIIFFSLEVFQSTNCFWWREKQNDD